MKSASIFMVSLECVARIAFWQNKSLKIDLLGSNFLFPIINEWQKPALGYFQRQLTPYFKNLISNRKNLSSIDLLLLLESEKTKVS